LNIKSAALVAFRLQRRDCGHSGGAGDKRPFNGPAVGHLGFSAPLGTRSFSFAHFAFSVGMIVGTLLGLVTIALGKLSIGLGTAGGFSSSASSLATRARSPVP